MVVRQATDDTIIWRTSFACRIDKAADIHSEYEVLFFHGNSGNTNKPQCYVVCTFPVLVSLTLVLYEIYVRCPMWLLYEGYGTSNGL